MTSTDLKQQYLKETGKSHMEISIDTGSNFYSDEYTEWLEQKLLLKRHNNPVVNESIRLDLPIMRQDCEFDEYRSRAFRARRY